MFSYDWLHVLQRFLHKISDFPAFSGDLLNFSHALKLETLKPARFFARRNATACQVGSLHETALTATTLGGSPAGPCEPHPPGSQRPPVAHDRSGLQGFNILCLDILAQMHLHAMLP